MIEARAIEAAGSLESSKDKAVNPVKKQSLENAVIEKGDSVKLDGQPTVGVILELQGKQATVAFGMMRSTVALKRLTLVSKKRK